MNILSVLTYVRGDSMAPHEMVIMLGIGFIVAGILFAIVLKIRPTPASFREILGVFAVFTLIGTCIVALGVMFP